MASFVFLEDYSVSICRVALEDLVIWAAYRKRNSVAGMGGREKFYWRPLMNLLLKALCIFQDWKQEQEEGYCRCPGQT